MTYLPTQEKAYAVGRSPKINPSVSLGGLTFNICVSMLLIALQNPIFRKNSGKQVMALPVPAPG
jgi:hypothetical protein